MVFHFPTLGGVKALIFASVPGVEGAVKSSVKVFGWLFSYDQKILAQDVRSVDYLCLNPWTLSSPKIGQVVFFCLLRSLMLLSQFCLYVCFW